MIWSLASFVQLSVAKQEELETDSTAKECYDALKARAHCEGPGEASSPY